MDRKPGSLTALFSRRCFLAKTRSRVILFYSIASFFFLSLNACGPSSEQPQATSDCVACHQDATPGIVKDW